MSNQYAWPKETIELVEVVVSYSGARIPPAELFFALTLGPDRTAAIFTPAVIDEDGRVGVQLDGTRDAGRYWIWAKHVKPGDADIPLIECGFITLY